MRYSRAIGSIGALSLIAASIVPLSGHGIAQARGTRAATTAKSCVTAPPPKVPNASAAKKYAGQTIIYYGDAVGCGHDMDLAAAKQFTKDTGIKVQVIEKPSDSDAAYATYSRLFQAHSTKIDVMMLDVIWPSAFGSYLANLKQYFKNPGKLYYASIVKNDTINGRLVGIPWFADFGLLYYRTDLLQKYHQSVPKTWTQLGKTAKVIQDGERKAGKKNFYGFVFQGKAYEGLTCDALEWIASSGGGTIFSGKKVTLNNGNAARVLNIIKGFVGTISPRDVTTYTEVESDNLFNAGGAAFLRNWPYAYAAAQLSAATKGKVGTAPLPHGDAQTRSVGTVGGWQLGLSNASTHKAAAVQWIKYLTSVPTEKWRAVVASFVPSIPSLSKVPAVLKAEPFLSTTKSVLRQPRPSSSLGTKYNQASNIFWQGISQILNGSDASSVLPGVASQLQRLAG